MNRPGDPREREQLLADVLQAGRRIGQAAVLFHSKVAAHFGLGPADMKALDIVEQHGPITPSALAEQMGFAPASVTAMIDRLEAKRLLRRAPHPTDGRRLLVEFDPAARDLLVPLYEGFVGSLNEMLEQFSDHELALVARAFDEAATRQIAAADAL